MSLTGIGLPPPYLVLLGYFGILTQSGRSAKGRTGAVKRLNAIGTQLAELDFAKAPNFVINGLKREELVASK